MTRFQRPTLEEYCKAIRLMLVANALTAKYRKLLTVHYAAPEHALTTNELAAAMGWDTHSPVNAHYGTLGNKLARRMKWRVPPGQPDACAIADFEGGGPKEGETRWIMRPELAAALEANRVVRT